jgi:methylated-DNA-[protein]-cysteine S-methyltransferase
VQNISSMMNSALIDMPFGQVAVVVNGGQLRIELLVVENSQNAEIRVDIESDDPLLNLACQQIVSYLKQPTSPFDLPLDQKGTEFQQIVWRAIAEIPCGQTRTYGELALQIGSGPRAVANACGANQWPLVIPCHRVVAKNGIGGFMQGKQNSLAIKKWLLQHEGVKGVVCE